MTAEDFLSVAILLIVLWPIAAVVGGIILGRHMRDR